MHSQVEASRHLGGEINPMAAPVGLPLPFCGGERPPVLLHFDVSLDEEHVFLRIQRGDQQFDLGERVHHYSLLVLARLRLQDRGQGLEPNSQGWVDIDHLSKMLGIEPAHLNIQIFRMRRQIARALPASPALENILERRRGQVRFGDLPVGIVRGSSIEAAAAAQVRPW